MTDPPPAGERTESSEVAPGLVMEVVHTHEPDGRALIYYNFRHAADRPTTEQGGGRRIDLNRRL